MAHTKAGGSSKNNRDSQPKYLGVKRSDGSVVHPGSIIVRQRGTKVRPGVNVRIGRDHTIYALASGLVRFSHQRRALFNGARAVRNFVNVVPFSAQRVFSHAQSQPQQVREKADADIADAK